MSDHTYNDTSKSVMIKMQGTNRRKRMRNHQKIKIEEVKKQIPVFKIEFR